MDCLISLFTIGIVKILIVTLSKNKINLPQPDKYKIFINLRRLQQTQINTRKK